MAKAKTFFSICLALAFLFIASVCFFKAFSQNHGIFLFVTRLAVGFVFYAMGVIYLWFGLQDEKDQNSS